MSKPDHKKLEEISVKLDAILKILENASKGKTSKAKETK